MAGLVVFHNNNDQRSESFLFRWLMSQGEGEKAVKIMKRIARLNGREVIILLMPPKIQIQVPQSVYRSVMSLCLKQKLEAAERWVNDTFIGSNDSKKFPTQQFIVGLWRPLSKQLYAPNHYPHDASLDAHMVILLMLQKEISINCFLISLQFDAHVRNIANLDFSIYWSFMISAGLELPADLLSIVGLELLGR